MIVFNNETCTFQVVAEDGTTIGFYDTQSDALTALNNYEVV